MCNGRELITRNQALNRVNHSQNLKRIRRVVGSGDHRISIPAGSAFSFSETRGQELISTPPPLVLFMKYTVPLILAFVTLKYQGKPETLFRKNSAPVWCFITATSLYRLIAGAMKQLTIHDGNCFQKLSNAALATGILSALSLLSMFLPYPVSLAPPLIWIPVSVVLAWPKAYDLFQRGIEGVKDKIQATVFWATKEASNSPP